MKLDVFGDRAEALESPPAREAWIEIIYRHICIADHKSPPAREAWIEMQEG